jgi:hypothetical protein
LAIVTAGAAADPAPALASPGPPLPTTSRIGEDCFPDAGRPLASALKAPPFATPVDDDCVPANSLPRAAWPVPLASAKSAKPFVSDESAGSTP